eukprot:Selendium_serpulae@DN5492_c0_g2_i2.p1
MTTCEVDPEMGQTYIHKMVLYGLTQSFSNPNSIQFFFNHGALDKSGNTLLHLAAMSKSIVMVKDVMRAMVNELHSVLWVIAAMMHKNNAGKRPLDLAENHSGIADWLKGQYVVLADWLHLVGPGGGLEELLRQAYEHHPDGNPIEIGVEIPADA